MSLWRQLIDSQVGEQVLERLGLTQVKPARVTHDSTGWEFLGAGTGPADRDWVELRQDLSDTLEAWRRNFLVRQVVRLTTAYVVGDGIRLSARQEAVETFLRLFWEHPKNRLERRLPGWCDELTRSGELFIALFTNPVDGLSYVKAIPATSIPLVETDPDDYERETGYEEIVPRQIGRKRWASIHTAGSLEPALLHYTVNKPVGATRGESDLTPILPWARRYSEWLKDRVLFNRLRSQLAGVVVELDDDSKLETKRRQYAANPPTGGSITVVGRGEKISFPSARVEGGDASADGRALRLAFAAGANVPLHFLAEGSSATRSTAEEMGDPTHRHYRMRQQDFRAILVDLCQTAYRRYGAVTGRPVADELQIEATAPDVSRADNRALAEAARTIVEAFAEMKRQGWITDPLAIRLAFKFAGEVLSEETVREILDQSDQIDRRL